MISLFYFVGLNCIVVVGPNLSPSSLKISIYLLIVGLDVHIMYRCLSFNTSL